MKKYIIIGFTSLITSSILTSIYLNNSDTLSFLGGILGSGLGVLGAYWIFNMGNIKKDKDELECLLVLLKFTVSKVDRVLSIPQNIKNSSINLTAFSYELVYDKEWYKYLKLIPKYEDKEDIVKFLDYIQRDKNMILRDLIQYRYNIIRILKAYDRYDESLNKDDFYNDIVNSYDIDIQLK
ncbi:hypothetical protein [Paraclostridium sordellii]|uniref:hypothetical protein n=1 Tax=Paraclostridium sordellii TaxID=1505 RepID=UPI0005E8ABA2|nr:hypothetical protein [Paeniclostridium sordellii]CEO08371.1 Uncharacterised protein [[Clostridium] sordellii] [Paeniclostridium sordellii]CEP87185.1 Uncharacterised protein [[Clostridium] sordellii] [Paeniclostridium sordellii]CEP99138.1 Uncharacterised protein [[Clostridium] sordellii] [Paeniclostridium sordellii]